MGSFDTITKEYMRDNSRFADVFNYYLYQGEAKIDPAQLRELDTAEIVLPFADKSDKLRGVQKSRDVLKYACAKEDGHTAFLLLGVENQTLVNYAMPVRNMLYDAMRYSHEIDGISAKHKDMSDYGSNAEFLSGFHKDDRLLPVITLVLYWSDQEWDGPRSLHEMIDFRDDKVRDFVADYKLNLLSPSMIDDFSTFRTYIGEAFEYIKYKNDKERLTEAMNANDDFRHVDRSTANVINALTGSNMKFSEGEGDIDMCKAIEDMRRESELIGEERGKARGEAIGEARGKAIGEAIGEAKTREKTLLASIRHLMENTQWSASKAMDMLGVPKSEQEIYRSKI